MKTKGYITLLFTLQLVAISAQRHIIDTSSMTQLSGVVVSELDLEPIP